MKKNQNLNSWVEPSILDTRVFAKSFDDNNKDKDIRPIDFYLQFGIISLVHTQLYFSLFLYTQFSIILQYFRTPKEIFFS